MGWRNQLRGNELLAQGKYVDDTKKGILGWVPLSSVGMGDAVGPV
jgi:hypothetical protein